MNERSLRISGRVRGILIVYGVAAFSLFFSRAIPSGASDEGRFASGSSVIAIGLVVQLAVLIARFLVKRYERERGMDREIYNQTMYLIELLADAATVLLFAVGTYSAILGSIPQL